MRDGHLAPYQELAWLTEPLTTEREWLAEHDSRFRELITALHDDAESDISFPRWVGSRMRDRKRSADDDAEVPWEAFQKRSPEARPRRHPLPALGRPGACPTGAPRGEAYRQPPDLDDWLVLLEDYALRCLAPSETRARRGERYDAIAAALRELGFQLTRQGIRRGTLGGRPAADGLAGEGARARRGARAPRPTRAATRCARSCCATPSWPPSARTTR